MQKILRIKVKPSQKQEEIIQQDNQNFIIRLKQKPEAGKANLALIKLLAKQFKISSSQIKIIKGKTSKNKIVALDIQAQTIKDNSYYYVVVDIIFTTYAESTLLDRKIPKETIKDALLNPGEVVEGKKNRRIAHKFIQDKLLRVVYELEEKAYIVITAYYTEPRRYLK